MTNRISPSQVLPTGAILGLHGSSASSKTSESLAKETLTLKSSEPEMARRGKWGKQYELALA